MELLASGELVKTYEYDPRSQGYMWVKLDFTIYSLN